MLSRRGWEGGRRLTFVDHPKSDFSTEYRGGVSATNVGRPRLILGEEFKGAICGLLASNMRKPEQEKSRRGNLYDKSNLVKWKNLMSK